MKAALHTLLGLLLLAAPAAMQAQFTFATNADNTLTVIRYSGGGAVIVPTNVNGSIVTSIGDGAFFDCFNVDSVTIPDTVTNIGETAFRFSGLTSITIPGSVSSIGGGAFSSCWSLTNATLDNGVTSIGEYAFQGCFGLIQVTIPDSVTSIGEDAFAGCITLTNVTIPRSVTSIGSAAFSDDPLTNIIIPGSVTSIETNAFQDLFALRSVYFQGNAPLVESSVFTNDNATVYYLPGTTGWSSPFAGLPAVLWNPLIQTADASFGVHSNQFGFNITGTTNIPIVVEACTNLANPVWTPLQVLTLTNGLFYFSEPLKTNSPGRFYRISSP